MPVVGAIFGGLDFANYFIAAQAPIPDTFKGDPTSYAALKEAGVAVLGWGTVRHRADQLPDPCFRHLPASSAPRNKAMKRGEEAAGLTRSRALLTEI